MIDSFRLFGFLIFIHLKLIPVFCSLILWEQCQKRQFQREIVARLIKHQVILHFSAHAEQRSILKSSGHCVMETISDIRLPIDMKGHKV